MSKPTTTAQDLIDRSNRLGADPRNTNYAGGKTSAKGTEHDPVTGDPVELLWVKGSGGDLGTLQTKNLAVLRLDRLRSLVDVYPGVDREDEMVAAFDYCLHGKGGAPASSWGWISPRSRRRTRRRSAASWAGTASPPGAPPAKKPSRTRCGSSTRPSAISMNCLLYTSPSPRD